MTPLSTEALQLLGDLLEDAEQELAIRGDDEKMEALGEIWALFVEQLHA